MAGRVVERPKGITQSQTLEASNALLAYYRRHTRKILARKAVSRLDDGDGAMIALQISLKKIPQRAPHKGHIFRVPHRLWERADVLFIVKDPQRLVKDELEGKVIEGGAVKVLGVENFRNRYGTHEGRREVLEMYDVFVCDDRILPMMPRILGKSFVKKKKLPTVVDMDKDIAKEIEKILQSVIFRYGSGTCTELCVGRTSWTPEMITENVMAVTEKLGACFARGWSDILSVNLKCRNLPRASLPLWDSLPVVGDYAFPEGRATRQKEMAGNRNNDIMRTERTYIPEAGHAEEGSGKKKESGLKSSRDTKSDLSRPERSKIESAAAKRVSKPNSPVIRKRRKTVGSERTKESRSNKDSPIKVHGASLAESELVTERLETKNEKGANRVSLRKKRKTDARTPLTERRKNVKK